MSLDLEQIITDLSLENNLSQLYIVFLITVPLSLMLYLIFNKYQHQILVDLGDHKWLVR